MGLTIKINKGERFAVGNSILSIDKAGNQLALHFEGDLRVIRDRDVLIPTHDDSTMKKIGLAVQAIYLNHDDRQTYMDFLATLYDVLAYEPDSLEAISEVVRLVADGNTFGALKYCRRLIAGNALVSA